MFTPGWNRSGWIPDTIRVWDVQVIQERAKFVGHLNYAKVISITPSQPPRNIRFYYLAPILTKDGRRDLE
jgi:hypothetical protein